MCPGHCSALYILCASSHLILILNFRCRCFDAHYIANSSCLDQSFCLLLRLSTISFQFSRSVVSDSLRPHESQHARPPCPSPTPGVYPNSCPSSQWCHPAISSSIVPFSSCPQSLPASVFSNDSTLCMMWPKYWSFSFSISLSSEHPGLISFRMDLLDLLAVQGTLQSLLQHHSQLFNTW